VHQTRSDRRLIHFLIDWGGGDTALALAKNPAITEPRHVKAVLGRCRWRAATGIPSPEPFGSRIQWPQFQAVLHLVKTGRVTFRGDYCLAAP